MIGSQLMLFLFWKFNYVNDYGVSTNFLERENCVLALVQYSNCDFVPIFLTLCFCPCYFELNCPFVPALDVRQMPIE